MAFLCVVRSFVYDTHDLNSSVFFRVARPVQGHAMPNRDAVDLEITIRTSGDHDVADARMEQPGNQAVSVPATDVPVTLDPTALLALALDPTAYGRALTEHLFADQRLRDVWRDARRVADGANLPLCVRLRLAATVGDIHALRWETLRDPLTQVPLATDARLRLVRYLDAADTRPITLGAKPALRAVLVVANPSDLSTYGMAEIDVDGEVGRVRKAMGDIALTVVGDVCRATLSAIQNALRASPTILCLICHGQHTGDDTTLWLEDDEGKTAHVKGSVLTQMIAQSDCPPLLVILIACEGGGKNHHDGPLAALGPRLAQAGVGAVLAMQAKLSMEAAKRLLPPLFEELARDGRIDRATSVARAALREGGEWWMPALWLRVRDGRLWHVPSVPSFRSVPACPVPHTPNLVGRNPVMEQIRSLFIRGQEAIGIYGIPGVGKTDVVRAIGSAPLSVAGFPGGVLYSELGPEPNHVSVLRAWITSLSEDGTVPPSDDVLVLADRLRALLNGRHVLMILDDVWESSRDVAQDLRTTLPPHGKLLISSRSPEVARVLAYNSDAIQMTPLSTDDGVELLRRLAEDAVDREPDMARLLVEELGGLPLAVRLAGLYIHQKRRRQHPCEGLRNSWRTQLATLSGDERRPGRKSTDLSLHAIIRLSYDALSSDQIRDGAGALAAFGSAPQSWGLEAMAAVWGCALPSVDDWEEKLVDAGLVEVDPTSRRYHLHQTIHAFLSTYLRQESCQQLVAYYTNWIEQLADNVTGSEQVTQQRVFEAIEQEHGQINLALDYALTHHTVAYALRICAAIWYFWERQGYISLGRRRLAETLAHPFDTTDHVQITARAKARFGDGCLAITCGDPSVAQQSFSDCLHLSEFIGNIPLKTNALVGLGKLALNNGQLDLAEQRFNETLICAEQAQDWRAVVTSMSSLSVVAYYRSEFDLAVKHAEQSLDLLQRYTPDDHKTCADVLTNLGLALYRRGDLSDARKEHTAALAIRRQLHDTEGIVYSLDNLAWIAVDEHNGDQALTLFQECLTLALQYNDIEGIARDIEGIAYALEGIARVAVMQNRIPQAVQFFAQANQLRTRHGFQLATVDAGALAEVMAEVQRQMGTAYNDSWAAAVTLPLDSTIAEALRSDG